MRNGPEKGTQKEKTQGYRPISPVLVESDDIQSNGAWQTRVEIFFSDFLLGHGLKLDENRYQEIFKQGSFLLRNWLKQYQLEVEFSQALMAMGERRPTRNKDEVYYLISMLNGHNIDIHWLSEKSKQVGFIIACSFKHISILESFIEHFTEKKSWPDYEIIKRAFLEAANHGHKAVLDLILKNVPKITENTLKEALQLAAQEGRRTAATYLLGCLRHRQYVGLSVSATAALQTAIQYNRVSLIKLLVEEKDTWGIQNTPIQEAQTVLKSIKREKSSRVKFGDPELTARLRNNEDIPALDAFIENPLILEGLMNAGDAIEHAGQNVSGLFRAFQPLSALTHLGNWVGLRSSPQPLTEEEFKRFQEKSDEVTLDTLIGRPEPKASRMQIWRQEVFHIAGDLLHRLKMDVLFDRITFPARDLLKKPSQHPYLQGSLLGAATIGFCYLVGAGPLAYFLSLMGSTFYTGLVVERNSFYRTKTASSNPPEPSTKEANAYASGSESARAWTPYCKSFGQFNDWRHVRNWGAGLMDTFDNEPEKSSRMRNV